MKKTKQFKGVVVKVFKIRKKVFTIGDTYSTECEKTYNILINAKRIK